RAVQWRRVAQLVPRSRCEERVAQRASALAATSDRPREAAGIELPPLERRDAADGLEYRYVALAIDRAKRIATLLVRAPSEPEPSEPEGFVRAGAGAWAIAAWRELDDAILHLRLNEPEVGVVLVHTSGDPQAILAVDGVLSRHRDHWLVREILLLQRRVLKPIDLTARTFYAMIEPGSAFAGALFELALAVDRSYMLATSEGAPPTIE